MTLTHGTISPAEDTGFPAQEPFCGKAGAGFSDQTLLSLPPPAPCLPGLSPKTTVRDSQIHPLCLRVVLGRKVPRIETLKSPGGDGGSGSGDTETQTQKAGGPRQPPWLPHMVFLHLSGNPVHAPAFTPPTYM